MVKRSLSRSSRSGRAARRRRLFAEQLEDRRLLAIGVQLLADMHLGPAGVEVHQPIVDMGGIAYFAGRNDSGDFKLWRSDGTTAGTYLLKDVSLSTASLSDPVYLRNIAGTLFFAGNDGVTGIELWKSDGTTEGTELVKDISVGIAPSRPIPIGELNGDLIFGAGINGLLGLWRSDGTSAGTERLHTVMPQVVGNLRANGTPQAANVNGTLFFRASQSAIGSELWKTDGTAAGTSLVKDIRPGANSSSPAEFHNVNGTLLFQANDGISGTELWKSDGTAEGTVIVKDIRPGTATTGPRYLTPVGGALFFRATDGTNGDELWKSDGTADGTVMVANLAPGSFSSSPVDLVNVSGLLYFNAVTPSGGLGQLWKSDGTAEGTVLVKDLGTSVTSGLQDVANVNGKLIFAHRPGGDGNNLWTSDGTAAGTVIVQNFAATSATSNATYLTNVGGRLMFAALSSTGTRVLWTSDGTPAGTRKVIPVQSVSAGSSPTEPVVVGSTAYFFASDEEHGKELWKTDGTLAGTQLVKDIRPGALGSAPRKLTAVGDTLFFMANDGTHGESLWRSDGTTAGTTLVKSIAASNATGSTFVDLNGVLHFFGTDPVNGDALWKSDGTPAGTTLVKDIRPGNAAAELFHLTNVGGTLFFRGNDGTNGSELWKSDGTPSGTSLFLDISPGPSSSLPGNLMNVNGALYFSAANSTGNKLWKSDGTANGTIALRNTGSLLTDFQGELYFLSFEAPSVRLFKTDGTVAGTVAIKEVGGSAGLPYMPAAAEVNGTLFFRAGGSSTSGYELWKSDGTATGTLLVKDIRSGSANSTPGFFHNMNGSLLFSANDGTGGRELWTSDGTAEGTQPLGIASGSASSGPDGFFTVNGRTLFAADDGVNGRELWTLVEVTALVANPDNYSMFEGASLTTAAATGVLANDLNPNPGGLTAVVAEPPQGSVSLGTDGSFSYSPPANFSGQDRFVYRVTNSGGQSALATATINVANVNNPPSGFDREVTTAEDVAYAFRFADFPLDDSADDPPNVLRGVRIASLPLVGSLELRDVPVAVGQIIPSADVFAFALQYTPPANASGNALASFTFQVQDIGGTANGGSDLDPTPKTITINVAPRNDLPVAVNDSYAIGEDSVLEVAAPGVLVNDVDEDAGDARTIVAVNGVAANVATTITLPSGSQLLVSADGGLRYTPGAQFQSLAQGATAVDSFTYIVADGAGTTSLATVAIVVQGQNDAPDIVLNPTFTALEGQSLTISGSFIDVDAGDSWTATIDLGDGGGPRPLALGANQQFQLSHVVFDNGTLPIAVTVQDSAGAQDRALAAIVVANVAPQGLVLEGPSQALRGQEVTFNASFTDPGLNDTVFDALINWGDGATTPITAFRGAGPEITVSAMHTYAAAGSYTVTVEVEDDDGGSAAATSQIVVTGRSGTGQPGTALRGGVLEINGTPQADNVALSLKGQRIVVNATYGRTNSNLSFPLSKVQRIVADLAGGDDSLRVASGIRKPLLADGGAGNDRITAGGGAAILVGGDGSDLLYGGASRDVLIGGAGRDQLWGFGKSDLLIDGETSFDANSEALSAIMSEWNARRSLAKRVSNLRTGSGQVLSGSGIALQPEQTVFGDSEVDLLMGGADTDWFLMETRDLARDKGGGEPLN